MKKTNQKTEAGYKNPKGDIVKPYTFPRGVTETFNLLDEAVKHWKEIRKNPLFEPCDWESCVFCQEFLGPGCPYCPIAEFGCKGCANSPYVPFNKFREECLLLKIRNGVFTAADMNKLVSLANEELQFLDVDVRKYLSWSAAQLEHTERPDLKDKDPIWVWDDDPRGKVLRPFYSWHGKGNGVLCYNDGLRTLRCWKNWRAVK